MSNTTTQHIIVKKNVQPQVDLRESLPIATKTINPKTKEKVWTCVLPGDTTESRVDFISPMNKEGKIDGSEVELQEGQFMANYSGGFTKAGNQLYFVGLFAKM